MTKTSGMTGHFMFQMVVDQKGLDAAIDALTSDLVNSGSEENKANPEWLAARTRRAERQAARFVDIALKNFFWKSEALNVFGLAVRMAELNRKLCVATDEDRPAISAEIQSLYSALIDLGDKALERLR